MTVIIECISWLIKVIEKILSWESCKCLRSHKVQNHEGERERKKGTKVLKQRDTTAI
jgi:hypothetical protein